MNIYFYIWSFCFVFCSAIFSPQLWSLRSTCRSFLWLLFHQQPICWVACEAGCRQKFWIKGQEKEAGIVLGRWDDYETAVRALLLYKIGADVQEAREWHGPMDLSICTCPPEKSLRPDCCGLLILAVPMIGQALSGVFKRMPPQISDPCVVSFCLKRWLPLVPGSH